MYGFLHDKRSALLQVHIHNTSTGRALPCLFIISQYSHSVKSRMNMGNSKSSPSTIKLSMHCPCESTVFSKGFPIKWWKDAQLDHILHVCRISLQDNSTTSAVGDLEMAPSVSVNFISLVTPCVALQEEEGATNSLNPMSLIATSWLGVKLYPTNLQWSSIVSLD